MHTFIKRALWGVVIAGGMTIIGTSAASAAETSGEDGILSGTQIESPITIPIEIVDNAISVLGTSTVQQSAAQQAAPTAEPSATQPTQEQAGPSTNGSDGVASGTQALIDVTVPLTVENNAISILGESNVSESDGSEDSGAWTEPVAQSPSTDAVTDGRDGIASGTQALIDATVPVTVEGNTIALLGESEVSNTSSSGDATSSEDPASSPVDGEGTLGVLLPLTSGADGVLGGTQIAAPISVPITVGGNGIAVLGESSVTRDVPASVIDPGTVPSVDPPTNPGVDTPTNPGVDTPTNPVVDVVPGPVPAVVTTVTGASSSMLATTGSTGMIGFVLAALGLIAGGALLLRRAV